MFMLSATHLRGVCQDYLLNCFLESITQNVRPSLLPRTHSRALTSLTHVRSASPSISLLILLTWKEGGGKPPHGMANGWMKQEERKREREKPNNIIPSPERQRASIYDARKVFGFMSSFLMSSFGTDWHDLDYKVHVTSLTLSAFLWPPWVRT